MTDFGRRFGDMFKSVYDPNKDGIIALAQTEALAYVDRGDVSGWDFTLSDFTTDSQYRDLDLSAIVPAGAISIKVAIEAKNDSVSKSIYLRKNGNTSGYHVSRLMTTVAGVLCSNVFDVFCDSDQVIEYYAMNSAWTVIDIFIMGWFI